MSREDSMATTPKQMMLEPVCPQPTYIESSGRWEWPLPEHAQFEGCCKSVVTASREWWEYTPSEARPHPMAEGVQLRDGKWYWVIPASTDVELANQRNSSKSNSQFQIDLETAAGSLAEACGIEESGSLLDDLHEALKKMEQRNVGYVTDEMAIKAINAAEVKFTAVKISVPAMKEALSAVASRDRENVTKHLPPNWPKRQIETIDTSEGEEFADGIYGVGWRDGYNEALHDAEKAIDAARQENKS